MAEKSKLLRIKTDEGIEIIAPFDSTLNGSSIKRLYKDVKFGVGPVIEEGFYYDIEWNIH